MGNKGEEYVYQVVCGVFNFISILAIVCYIVFLWWACIVSTGSQVKKWTVRQC